MRATVTQIGHSTGVILPKEAVARLKVKLDYRIGLKYTLLLGSDRNKNKCPQPRCFQ
jgi:antitoxin component of MazEF toxin-antitoxin module